MYLKSKIHVYGNILSAYKKYTLKRKPNRRMEKVSLENTKHKKSGIAVLIKTLRQIAFLKIRGKGEIFYNYKRASTSGR